MTWPDEDQPGTPMPEWPDEEPSAEVLKVECAIADLIDWKLGPAGRPFPEELLLPMRGQPSIAAAILQVSQVIEVPKKKSVKSETVAEMKIRRGDPGGLTVIELPAETGWGASTLRRMFEGEEGVSRIVQKETLHGRRYVSVRIPRHVAGRVLARHTQRP
jgi:hypothetical protein